MSAFVVPAFHINALVSWAATRQACDYYWASRRREIRGDEQRIASVLHAENVRSVNSRYREHEVAHGFRFAWVPPSLLEPVDVIKACHGYAYQAMETDDWETTEAHAIIKAIEGRAVRSLPGYDESQAWVLDPSRLTA